MDVVWQVFAVKYAERNGRTRQDSFILDDDHATPHAMDYFIWILKSSAGVIVVDTGYDRSEGERRGRPILRDPGDAIAAVGIDPMAVENLIITHMHYDHAGALDRFPRATVHIQETEMAFVTGPCMCHEHLRKPFTAEHACQMVRRLFEGRVQFHNGDGIVAPGVSIHRIGGHTRGLQVVRVRTEAGWLCLASDASHYYENFLRAKPFPIVVDLAAMLDGFRRIQSLADKPSLVIPGHDPLVFSYFDPPAGGPDFVLRLDQGPARPVAGTGR
ncbi:N-acyl homoserine lactonase family protein [Oceanibacterium hippocampi]|uniref:N-acyl homoserine lactonase n=1 Tax=Oceanibacterium hippocampi TaxID=745714 RepID=A0A1Y5TM61_9PROT|nr:N-acyl homoserine lactonase family protein [Oceanibacterium hippocampi]SLN65181.1 N-acyl homoserine lactonase [Oceanibacterium hippocampi]